MSTPDTPSVEITTEEADHTDHRYNVWASINRPDGVDTTASVGLPCDATAGDIASSLAAVMTGVAATFGQGLADQVAMRIVDPDAPPVSTSPAGRLTVRVCDQLLEEARENGVSPEDVRIQLNGRSMLMTDVRHILDAIGHR